MYGAIPFSPQCPAARRPLPEELEARVVWVAPSDRDDLLERLGVGA
jgi:hypothetical protein